MHMLHLRSLLMLFFCAPGLCSQSTTTTHLVWALDAGSQVNPSPLLRIYGPDGVQRATAPVPGTSQARGFTFDDGGNCYVCRGDEVRKLDRVGVDTGIVFLPPAGASKAQDALFVPPSSIWVAWGASAPASSVALYDLLGNLQNSFGPGGLDHPRRLAAPPGPAPATIYVANRGSNEILALDPATGTFSQVSALLGGTLGPIGLSFDNARNLLWVVGDFGQVADIGTLTLDLSVPFPVAFQTVLTFGGGSIPGLTAPANCFFDRFRRLYVAGRSVNSGTPGIYILDAQSSASLPPITTWPSAGSAPANVLDVRAQPLPVEICGPKDENGALMIEEGVLHTYKFRAPDFAGSFYVAALSTPWADFSSGFAPGILDPGLTFAPPEARGLPFTCDVVFQLTTGVATLGGPALWFLSPNLPCPSLGLNNAHDLDLNLAGFIGTLDANGEGTALISKLNIYPGLDGTCLNLSFITLDLSNTASLVGLVATPVPIVIRVNPSQVTPCP